MAYVPYRRRSRSRLQFRSCLQEFFFCVRQIFRLRLQNFRKYRYTTMYLIECSSYNVYDPVLLFSVIVLDLSATTGTKKKNEKLRMLVYEQENAYM